VFFVHNHVIFFGFFVTIVTIKFCYETSLYNNLDNEYLGKQTTKVKRKILGIFVCMLMLVMIPLVAGMTVDSEPDDPETTDFGRTIIRGFVFNYKPSGFFECRNLVLVIIVKKNLLTI